MQMNTKKLCFVFDNRLSTEQNKILFLAYT